MTHYKTASKQALTIPLHHLHCLVCIYSHIKINCSRGRGSWVMRTFKKFYFKRYSNELKIYLNYSQKTNTKNNLIMLISNDSLIEINCKTTLLFDESAKLRPLRGHVPTCIACLRAHVLTCLACLRAHVPCVPTCSRDITKISFQ